jgi:hypothetical protein
VLGLKLGNRTATPAPAPPALSYERTVPRGYVHVRALSEVFLTDSAQTGPDTYVLAAQLPRAHTLWSDRQLAHHDPVVTVEVGRQSAFLIAHQYCGVPVGTKVYLEWLRFQVKDLKAYHDDGVAPPEGIVHARLTDRQERDGFLSAMEFHGQLTIGERVAMEVGGRFHMMPREEYGLLRAHGRARKGLGKWPAQRPVPHPVAPAMTGRRDERNIVLEERMVSSSIDERSRYALIVDESHPAYFDHPHDHVTGSLILEMYRQAAIATAYRTRAMPAPLATVTGCQVRFSEFAELDAQSECSAWVSDVSADGVVTVRLVLHQLGADIADAELTLLPVR